MTASLLDIIALPLKGRQLIEASAGTGKTYNITRLYLRGLLEKRLAVQQLLVMTFTNAATEELRGRIAQTLRSTLQLWQALVDGEQDPSELDEFYAHLWQTVAPEEAIRLLNAALLEFDDAAVFTIHGFCQRVLKEQAFQLGTGFNSELILNGTELTLLAAQDWLRTVSQRPDDFALLIGAGWHQPETLLHEFGKAMQSTIEPFAVDEQSRALDEQELDAELQAQFTKRFEQMYELVMQHAEAFVVTQIDSRKTPEQREERLGEWQAFQQWLASGAVGAIPEAANNFSDGRRYGAKAKELKPILKEISDFKKELKTQLTKYAEKNQQRTQFLAANQLIIEAFSYIRAHVARQKALSGSVDFNDLISFTAQQLKNDDGTLAKTLRERYPIALVDEFQDTDADQYAIFDKIYADTSNALLLMIGDPKQAIYGFRGGDVFTYLRAGKEAHHQWVMNTNWRSTQPMVAAYNRLFHGAPTDQPVRDVFGYGIEYFPVESTDKAAAAGEPLVDPSTDRAAMNYIYLPDSNDDNVNKDALQRAIAQWISTEVLRLLNDATLSGEALKPSDIAILVRDGSEADVIQRALRERGLPSVYMSNQASLYDSQEALDVLRLLSGLWHVDDQRRLLAAAGTPLMGYSSAQILALLDDDDEHAWDSFMARVVSLRQQWMQQGVMAVLLSLMQQECCATLGIQSASQVERRLTNYLHLAEQLEHIHQNHRQPGQLLLWLQRQIESPFDAGEHVQRLESDATLIQVITQHGSKGLEYPIVFVPFPSLYKDPTKRKQQTLKSMQYFDAEQSKQVYQIGATERTFKALTAQNAAEAMRLLYVAITRASHRCYVGAANFNDYWHSPLARAIDVSQHQDWQTVLTELVNEGAGHSVLITVDQADVADHRSPLQADLELSVARSKVLDHPDWRLLSFSSLTRQTAAEKRATREVEIEVPDSNIARTLLDDMVDAATKADFRFQFARGAQAGNLLHDVLEVVDFSAPDWQGDAAVVMQQHQLEESQVLPMIEWLEDVLKTPLDTGNTLCLAQLPVADTLREAEFYFPLAEVSWSQLSQLLRQHRDDVAQGGHEVLAVPALQSATLDGMMHGFIDLIFCHQGRYYLADYKSTHLGNNDSDYGFTELHHSVQHHLYDLQYLIYAVALHRLLKQRMADYDPAEHFGGVYYLYLRGMHSTNVANEGVYHAQLDAELLTQLDAAMGDIGGER